MSAPSSSSVVSLTLSRLSQTVSALSVDPSGSRVVSGSYDYDCKLWDFGGMNASFKPFRSWECKEGHQVGPLLDRALLSPLTHSPIDPRRPILALW